MRIITGSCLCLMVVQSLCLDSIFDEWTIFLLNVYIYVTRWICCPILAVEDSCSHVSDTCMLHKGKMFWPEEVSDNKKMILQLWLLDDHHKSFPWAFELTFPWIERVQVHTLSWVHPSNYHLANKIVPQVELCLHGGSYSHKHISETLKRPYLDEVK